MKTIIIKPKNKEEEAFLHKLLKKLNIESNLVEEPVPNYETWKAMKDAESGNIKPAKDSDTLFKDLGI